MKYPGSGGHQSTMFVEQVGTVTALFDQWNDCERTVVLYALLKRLPFSNLKFLQLSIEYNIAQNINSFAGQQGSITGGTGGGTVSTTAGINTSAGSGKSQQQQQSANSSTTSTTQYGNGCNFNKFHLLESNSNNGIFLTKLISVYKNFRPPDMGQPPPPLDTSGRVPVVYGIGNVPYETKEDILQDILTYLPLLKPGNEEAKSAYISLVPIVVADSIKQLVPTDIVQQILSYLLIHPAVTSEDRRSLAHWLHHLEEHINSSYIDTSSTASVTPTSAAVASAKLGNRIGSFAVTANKVTGNGLPFAAINETGPMPLNCWDANGSRSASCGTKLGSQSSSSSMHTQPEMVGILWNTDMAQTVTVPKAGSQDYVCDDHVIREFRKTIGRNLDGSSTTALVPVLKSTSSSLTSCKSSSSASSSASSTSSISSSSGGVKSGGVVPTAAAATKLIGAGNSGVTKDAAAVFVVMPSSTEQEDLHVSFSKNGTEILDFDCDDDNKSNTQIAFEAPPPPINPRLVADAYLAVPHHLDNCFCGSGTPSGQCALLMSSNALKTRRSNSLTTAPVTLSYPGQATSSSSTENLLQLKPRSYSLSIEGHRGSLMSCGSETRLEELKPSGLMGKMGGGNPGMNCIGQWLKSLRLHKYVWLFSNITYEQMMDISEEYLANLSVTKGARHKLVLCIQKLKERGAVLHQMEQQLLAGEVHVAPMLEELTNIVLTPMKPIDPFSKDNIAGLFIKVVEMVGSILVTRPIQSPNEEEFVTTFLWILERALHNEAFLGQMNLLKELKFKVSKIKLQFVSKPHFGKVVVATGGGAGIGTTGVVGTGGSAAVCGGGVGVGGGVVNINKSRWPVQPPTKKPTPSAGVCGVGPSLPGMERKNSGSSLQTFSAMIQSTAGGVGQQQQPPPTIPPQQQHLKQLDEKNYFNALTGKVTLGSAGQSQQQQYSKSSSYPSFSQNMKYSNPHLGHPSIIPGPAGKVSVQIPPLAAQQQQPQQPSSVAGNKNGPPMFNANSVNHQQQLGLLGSSNGGVVGGGGSTIYHRHSMNSLMPGSVSQPLVMGSVDKKMPLSGGGGGQGQQQQQQLGQQQQQRQENNENIDIGNQCKDKNNICDINSRLEFLCLQMTEQAIN